MSRSGDGMYYHPFFFGSSYVRLSGSSRVAGFHGAGRETLAFASDVPLQTPRYRVIPKTTDV